MFPLCAHHEFDGLSPVNQRFSHELRLAGLGRNWRKIMAPRSEENDSKEHQ